MNTIRKTKQFKIGEYAKGGIIRVDITKEEPDRSLVEVKALDWNTKQTLMADWAETDNSRWQSNIDNTLNEMTTSYYADKIMSYINEQIKSIK
jgi:hypothetical protein